MATKQQSYHHGDLRTALLEAALATVEREGVDALSFRQLARIANVSPGAPYHHFRDKNELLAVLARRGFEALEAELAASCSDGSDPEHCVEQLVQAYLRFARSSPKLYALLFIPGVTRPESLELIEPQALACFDRLQAALAVVDPAAAPSDIRERALTLWSLLHGLVSLLDIGPLTRSLSSQADAELAGAVRDEAGLGVSVGGGAAQFRKVAVSEKQKAEPDRQQRQGRCGSHQQHRSGAGGVAPLSAFVQPIPTGTSLHHDAAVQQGLQPALIAGLLGDERGRALVRRRQLAAQLVHDPLLGGRGSRRSHRRRQVRHPLLAVQPMIS
jgi:AcrR family transcriptional regulator